MLSSGGDDRLSLCHFPYSLARGIGFLRIRVGLPFTRFIQQWWKHPVHFLSRQICFDAYELQTTGTPQTPGMREHKWRINADFETG